MKKRFLVLAVETIAVSLISLFFVWKFYLEPGLSGGSPSVRLAVRPPGRSPRSSGGPVRRGGSLVAKV